jgi:hypothetical protein
MLTNSVYDLQSAFGTNKLDEILASRITLQVFSFLHGSGNCKACLFIYFLYRCFLFG